MNRRRPLLSARSSGLIAVTVLALAACGDDSPEPVASSPDATLPATPGTTAPSDTYRYATGPDDVVIEVGYEGGFVPAQFNFTRTPVAMITGDGRAFTTGPVIAIYPGPLLPNVLERSITPAGIEQLLATADDLGLFAEVDYPRNDQIADAADTVVTITVDGTIYRHQAYALDVQPVAEEASGNLAAFVGALSDLEGTVGADALGPEEAFVPEQYLIQATPVDPATLSTDVEPTIVDWPADAAVRLADAVDCAEVPVAEFEPLFADATQLTFFTDADVTYQIAVVQQLPGRAC